jgi:hypothetical protein
LARPSTVQKLAPAGEQKFQIGGPNKL